MRSWIDLTITSSVLTGGVLLFFLLWALWIHTAIWQELIWHDCQAAMKEAHECGFVFEKKRLVAGWSMRKEIDGQQWYVHWSGGIRGARSLLCCATQKNRLPYLMSAEQFQQQVLSKISGEAPHSAPISRPENG